MSTVRTAPPTTPIGMAAPPPAPTSRSATWSLLCGVAGLIIPIPTSLVAIALSIRALRVTRPGGGYLGRGYAIVGLVTGAFGLVLVMIYVLLALLVLVSVEHVRVQAMGGALGRVRSAAVNVARAEGRYPGHVASALVDPNLGVTLHHMALGGGLPLPGETMVGDYDLASWDDDDESRAALKAALDALDVSAPCYRFGEAWIVRLPSPTDEPAIVFAWCTFPDAEMISFCFDDGTSRAARMVEWEAIWKADAAARERRGLPPFQPEGP